MVTNLSALPGAGVRVPNAGIVILNSYIVMLLERLGLIKANAFKSKEAQLEAVHYLQYVVTGLSQTEASQLVLNKVLCGLPPNATINPGIEVTKDQKELMEGLIQSVISYWTVIGDTSIEGFRGNWLVRDGILRETEAHWELTVEKRAYDILLQHSPFSFSILKLPWIEKPLHVNWSY